MKLKKKKQKKERQAEALISTIKKYYVRSLLIAYINDHSIYSTVQYIKLYIYYV